MYFIYFLSCYNFFSILTNHSHKLISYHISTIHTLSALYLIYNDYDKYELSELSTSYYIFDTCNLWLTNYEKNKLFYTFHHIMALYFMYQIHDIIFFYYKYIEISNIAIFHTYYTLKLTKNKIIKKFTVFYELMWYGYFRLIVPLITYNEILKYDDITCLLYSVGFLFYLFGLYSTYVLSNHFVTI